MINSWLIPCVAFVLFAVVAWKWNRGAQLRRFLRAFTEEQTCWDEADDAFLTAFEEAYRLPPGMARRLPPEATPMRVYLVLYPEHCIYDDSEPIRFQKALSKRLGKVTEDVLNTTFRDLAARWRAASERTSA